MIGTRRKKSKRVLAVLMAALLTVIVFFAAFLIVENLDHDCEGEHCPVCECIQVCEAVLQQMGTGLLPVFCAVLAIVAAFVTVSGFTSVCLQQNLITLKIRLNI